MPSVRYKSLCARWRAANTPFEDNGGNGRIVPDITVTQRRESPLCLVSVHAVNHYNKDEGFKPADLYTGGLAIALAEQFNASVVYNTQRVPAISPWQKRTAADDAVADLARERPDLVVLDLHGVRNNPHFDIAIGTSVQPPNAEQQKMIELFTALARRNGLTVAVNPEGYRADGQRTVTTRALAVTPRCLQFEFSRSCRQPDGSTPESRAMVRTMGAFLRKLGT
jgi:hypothetical protein